MNVKVYQYRSSNYIKIMKSEHNYLKVFAISEFLKVSVTRCLTEEHSFAKAAATFVASFIAIPFNIYIASFKIIKIVRKNFDSIKYFDWMKNILV